MKQNGLFRKRKGTFAGDMPTANDEPPVLDAPPPAPLPASDASGHVPHDGARIWYASYGEGPPVILLHGAFGNGEDWGNQVPALMRAGYRAILVDSRGHGRSTRDAGPLGYERMAADVVAVMDALRIDAARVVGWSDGAILSLVLAMKHPARVARAFAFAGNMDLSGVKEVDPTAPILVRAFARAKAAYARLSATPGDFAEFSRAVNTMMATEPSYAAADLARIGARVAVVLGEHDEFITRAHVDYVARTIPAATLILLPGVSHFAPLQKPRDFNDALLAFLGGA